jgi:hypothetical protein
VQQRLVLLLSVLHVAYSRGCCRPKQRRRQCDARLASACCTAGQAVQRALCQSAALRRQLVMMTAWLRLLGVSFHSKSKSPG